MTQDNSGKQIPCAHDFQDMMASIFRAFKDGAEGENPAEANSLFGKTENKTGEKLLNRLIRRVNPAVLLAKKPSLFSTGLDIGTSSIKSVIISYESAKPQLASLDCEEIPHDDFESAGRPEIIKECLKKMLSRRAIKGDPFVSIPLPNLLVETLYLPVMPANELDKAIRWEAKEKLMVDEESSIIDYICLEEINVAQQAQKEILFFSTPKKEIMDNYRMLSSFGVRPQAIRPSFLASFQAFENKSAWGADETVAFLDIGAGSTKFSVIARGYIRFNRIIDFSADSMTRSISDYCRISYEEAEASKREIGMSRMALEEDRKDSSVAAEPRVRISHALGLHLDQLITEIQHSFNYYSLQVSPVAVNKIDRMIITGGGSSVKGLCEFFRSRLNIPVEIPNPFNYLKLKAGAANRADFLNTGPRFAAALGLAQK